MVLFRSGKHTNIKFPQLNFHISRFMTVCLKLTHNPPFQGALRDEASQQA
jgi:hypothetical protein